MHTVYRAQATARRLAVVAEPRLAITSGDEVGMNWELIDQIISGVRAGRSNQTRQRRGNEGLCYGGAFEEFLQLLYKLPTNIHEAVDFPATYSGIQKRTPQIKGDTYGRT